MTTAEFTASFRARTNANSTVLSDANAMRIINLARLTVDDYVVKENSSLYNMRFIEDLVADTREYRISHTTRVIHFIQANLKQTGGSDNWVTLLPANYGVEYQQGDDETIIQSHFANSYPNAKFWRDGNFIFILSGDIISVTNGLKIYANGRPSNITDLTEATRDLAEYAPNPTATPGVPLEMQPAWLVLASRIYKLESDKSATLDPEEQDVYNLLAVASIKLRDKTPIYNDTYQLNIERSRSDNGFSY